MRTVLFFVLQLVISLFVTASIMPVILATLPEAGQPAVGLSLMAVVLLVTFLGVRLVWPVKKA
jgi:predicted membrane channel-forming protein YqfA (hemolysin III family)